MHIPPLSQTLRCEYQRWVRLCDAHATAESDSAVRMPPLSQARRCTCHRWVRLCCVHVTAEYDSAEWMPLLIPTLWCACHRWVRFCGVHVTAESDSEVCMPPLIQTLWCACHRWARLCGVHVTAESDSAVCMPKLSQWRHHGVQMLLLLGKHLYVIAEYIFCYLLFRGDQVGSWHCPANNQTLQSFLNKVTKQLLISKYLWPTQGYNYSTLGYTIYIWITGWGVWRLSKF